MKQQLLIRLVQGIIDLVIFSRLETEENACQILSKAIERFSIKKMTTNNLSDWFLNMMGIHKHYFSQEQIGAQIADIRLILRLIDSDGITIKYTEQWSFDLVRASKMISQERTQSNIKETLIYLLEMVQNMPLTTWLGKNRNFSKQYSIYYLISRSTHQTRPINTNKINFQNSLSNFILHIDIHLINDPPFQSNSRDRSIQIVDFEDIKRKQSYSTMNSSHNSSSDLQSSCNQICNQSFPLNFQEDQSFQQNQISILLEQSDEEYEVIDSQQNIKLNHFKQVLRKFSQTLQTQILY